MRLLKKMLSKIHTSTQPSLEGSRNIAYYDPDYYEAMNKLDIIKHKIKVNLIYRV